MITTTKLLSLDPATHITGYALHSQCAKQGDMLGFRLDKYGLIKAKTIKKADLSGNDLKDTNMRCLDINSQIRNFIMVELPTEMVLEYPAFQGGPRGNSAARAGDTLKLAFLCGKIVTGWELYMAEVYKKSTLRIMLPMPVLLTPQQWKGQCPKTVTQQRCEDLYGVTLKKKEDDNFIDAIMIGHFWILKNGHLISMTTKKSERQDLVSPKDS